MSDKTTIEWADATWNPIVGCSVLSPGCKHCYAMRWAHRLATLNEASAYRGLTQMTESGPVWTGEVGFVESALLKPFSWKGARGVFVNSMGDLFHEGVSDDEIEFVLCAAALCDQHTFYVLTKRAERMAAFMRSENRKRSIAERTMAISNLLAQAARSHEARVKLDHFSSVFAGSDPLKNVWFGVSIEDRRRLYERLPRLLATLAVRRFVSFEPLLEDVAPHIGDVWRGDLGDTPHIDWAIVGGESGRGARPMDIQWARNLRDWALGCKTPPAFFFKQIGGVNKKASGRLLDGREWNERPSIAAIERAA